MKKYIGRSFTVLAAVLFLSISVLEMTAHARAGGSRSFGSRGSRSYSRPAAPTYQQQTRPYQPQQSAPGQAAFQQSPGGGFMRSMAGGLMGGMLGSMLFSGMAGAGTGMGGMGGGIGLFDLLLLAGLGYLLFRFVRGRKPHSTR